MKIAVIGYSGSGKSTLAKRISEEYSLPLLYLDTVHWLPDWCERDTEEAQKIVSVLAIFNSKRDYLRVLRKFI